jgi:hypothetical protein
MPSQGKVSQHIFKYPSHICSTALRPAMNRIFGLSRTSRVLFCLRKQPIATLLHLRNLEEAVYYLALTPVLISDFP